MNQLKDTKSLLKLGPATVMILFGINQFTNPSDWTKYVPRWILPYSPFDPETIIRLHAIVNLALGFLLLSKFNPLLITRLTVAWWISIIPFAFMSDWTVGVRDISILISLLALLGLL